MSDERLQECRSYLSTCGSSVCEDLFAAVIALRASLQEAEAENRRLSEASQSIAALLHKEIAELSASLQEKELAAESIRRGAEIWHSRAEAHRMAGEAKEARITELETALTSSNSPALCQCSQCRDIVAELSRLRGAK